MFQHLAEGVGESADAHRRYYGEYMSFMEITEDFYLQTIRRVVKERWTAPNNLSGEASRCAHR